MDSFAKLIATPSVSSIDPRLDQSNKIIIDLLANWFEDAGFNIEIMPVSNDPDKFNLIACRGEGEQGLVLSGHTDTVPFNADAWNQDPFLLTEKDNKLYGLGVSDMKCFFPIVNDVIQKLELNKINQPLIILATADEESTMSGARALVNSGKSLGRHALIGEPTGLKPVHMHKGVLIEIVELSGRAGHASDPSLGNSALEGMHDVISSLMKWRGELQENFINNDFAVPFPTINFGRIQGGDNPNRICAKCELAMDFRILPGMQLNQIRSEFRDHVNNAVSGSGLEVNFHSVFDGAPGMETSLNAEIIKLSEKLSGQSSGTVAFGTEGPYLNSMGMETVILGPGDIDQAHQANEYIKMDRILPMQEILTKMIGHFCLGSYNVD